ncbi:FAD:protein FMN transferase [Saccharopolyspora sp. K220]|uniref:FAD:protein FMN transferase n=1 Tax=Saccharopolyspora soli TaxID=2926618 RepID=UPI001F577BEE|nr:FAD:protein FMN transferase [Saccharopolyspora soli]MCI2420364.1 FAD:protein FMN transferase [Saccharopolyspora soli]
MGLPISMDVRSTAPAVLAAASRAFDWLREVDRRFSPFRDGSEVRLCGGDPATPARASAELIEIVDLCMRYEQDSGGAFRAWLPGRRFDPCGVVKGWAVQRAGELLRRAGADQFCLNAGGDVLAVGEAEPGRAWRVGIRHPEIAHQVCAVFDVRDCAVATSGSYERGAHIIDGRTGHPARELLSLTVLAPDLTTADAVSTAAFAMGVDGIAWAASRPGCLVFAVDAERQVHRSSLLDEPVVTPELLATEWRHGSGS